MSWVNRLSSRVPQAVRNRGKRYHDNYSVHIQRGSANRVEATVHGTLPYRVRIRIDDQKVVVDCNCPYYETEGICKHVWATLLAAEEDGYLSRIASMWNPILVRSGQSDESDEEDSGPRKENASRNLEWKKQL